MDNGDNVSGQAEAKLHFYIPVERQAQRFRELIIYVSKMSVDDVNFGAIKLNKILYYSDFRAFERFGVPLTGVVYQKLRLGPAPKPLLGFRRALIEEGALALKHVQMGNVFQDRTVALRDPVMSHFSQDEIIVVDEVIRDLWDQNATEVSDASHDVRWRVLVIGQNLPYEFAFLDTNGPTESDVNRTAELARELGW